MTAIEQLLEEGLAAVDSGGLEEARAIYERATQIAPMNTPEGVAARIRQASLLQELGEPEQAIKVVSPLLEGRMGRRDFYSIIGWCQSDLNNLQAAENAFRQSLRLKPTPEVWVFLYDVLLRMDKDDETVHCLHEALQLDPDYEEAHYYLGSYYRGCENLDFAEHHLRRAIEIDACYAAAYGELGTVLFRRNLIARIHRIGAYGEAQSMLKKSIRLSTPMESVWPRMHLGNLLVYIGHHEKAEKQFERILKIWPTCGAGLWLYADLLSSTGEDNEKAETLIRQAIENDPQDGTPYFYLGKHFLRLRRDDEAKTALQKAFQLGQEKAKKLLDEIESR